ncbi:Fe(3+) ABC transporter substrate-binding protein [Fulvivirgaceae bacterium BMA10]|uniref:Fe(3+) ABC transporter substrate-binding protein n=1 Tax=Splendidivirga corallicola TaxID=3051826 RepID=A0ABT8KRE4_9BACT|nr:Fe(3+) ABC transporter substrate-binding protein [Fulvivirgaceae bacterium BMA10]
MFKKIFYLTIFSLTLLVGCNNQSSKKEAAETEAKEVNVYTHRHYEADQQLFKAFTEQTGIKVNVVNASADELIQKLELEGDKSPADILITVDAGRLHRAKQKGLLKSVNSDKLNANIPSKFRDPEGHWYGMTYRARVIAYAKDRVDASALSTYEDLTNEKWKGKILIRSSSNIYNQSLLASIIAAQNEDGAKDWASGLVANMARDPKGNDRDQVKAVAAGEGDIAIVNTYYIGKLLNSDNEEEVKAGEAINIFFPNQDDRGAHINVSGAAVTKYSPNEENAIKFLEFLSDTEAQSVFAEANFEYPVKEGIEVDSLLQSWGTFKSDEINLSVLGENNSKAVIIFDEVGWK